MYICDRDFVFVSTFFFIGIIMQLFRLCDILVLFFIFIITPNRKSFYEEIVLDATMHTKTHPNKNVGIKSSAHGVFLE